jgi:hypothetical protein
MTADLYEVEPQVGHLSPDDIAGVMAIVDGPALDADRPVDLDDDGYGWESDR